jgi:hypothetical protein
MCISSKPISITAHLLIWLKSGDNNSVDKWARLVRQPSGGRISTRKKKIGDRR